MMHSVYYHEILLNGILFSLYFVRGIVHNSRTNVYVCFPFLHIRHNKVLSRRDVFSFPHIRRSMVSFAYGAFSSRRIRRSRILLRVPPSQRIHHNTASLLRYSTI